MMQAATDIFLGWQRIKGLDGIDPRLLRPPAPRLEGRRRRRTVAHPGRRRTTRGSAGRRWPGRTPAGATGSRSPSYLGQGDTFDRAIAEFSAAYADQNERDYEAFANAVESGRLEALTGL